jgi:CRISPR-associated endoribonuclease Cas6
MSPFSGTLNYTGSPLRAAFLNLVRDCDYELSNNIHETGAIRQYSLHPFPFNRQFNTNFNEGEEYRFKVNLLDADKFKDAIRNIALGINSDIRLHHHAFPIRRIDFDHNDANQLMTGWTEPVKEIDVKSIRIGMHFETPTQLSVYGSDYACVLPQPARVFTALLRVWESIEKSSTVEYTSEYRDWVEQNVHISRHRIRTAHVPIGRRRQVVGFVGDVDYIIDTADSQLVALTVGLTRFAEFSNIGKNRTAGFGKVSVDVTGG